MGLLKNTSTWLPELQVFVFAKPKSMEIIIKMQICIVKP